MANTDCEKILNLIPLYIDKCLTQEENDTVSRHIASCDACRKEYGFLSSLMNTAATLEETDLSADFHKKLMEKATDLKNKKRTQRIVLLKRSSAGVAAAAVVALCVVTFGNINKTINTEQPDSAISSTPDEIISTDIVTYTTEEKKPAEPVQDTAAKKAGTPKQTETTAPAAAPVEDFTVDNNEQPASGGGGGSASANTQAESIPTAAETLLLTEPLPFTVASISLTDEVNDAVMKILASYEKDSIGYIVPDINAVLRKIAELGVEVNATTTTEYTQNYITIE